MRYSFNKVESNNRCRRPKWLEIALSQFIVRVTVFSVLILARSTEAKFTKEQSFRTKRSICCLSMSLQENRRKFPIEQEHEFPHEWHGICAPHMHRKCNKKCKSHLNYTLSVETCSGRSRNFTTALFNFVSSLEKRTAEHPAKSAYIFTISRTSWKQWNVLFQRDFAI